MSRIIAFDPSGNFSEREGKGSSGWALYVDGKLEGFGEIKSEDSATIEQHFHKHYVLLSDLKPDTVVIETYKLNPSKAMQQSWSALETPQLIGYLRMVCYLSSKKVVFQDPKDKVRVSDLILHHLDVIQQVGKQYHCLGRKTNLHMRDAIRHGYYYLKYGKAN